MPVVDQAEFDRQKAVAQARRATRPAASRGGRGPSSPGRAGRGGQGTGLTWNRASNSGGAMIGTAGWKPKPDQAYADYEGDGWGGGGGSRGGAPPPSGQSQATVQDNPYLKEVMGYYRDLWGQAQTLSGQAQDPTAAIKQYQRDRTQGLADTQAGAGARGFAPGTGMSIAQMANYGNKSDQGSQKIAVDVKNQGLNFQKDLLGQMASGLAGFTGAADANAKGQLGLLNYGNDSRRTDIDAWYKENQLANERTQIKTQNQVAQINAMVQLAGLV